MATTKRRRTKAGGGGRPRSEAVDAAILRAALALFFEHGVAGASIERIARRAGVAKTSIYRRWSSREALLAHAIEAFRNTIGPTAEQVDATPAEAFGALLVEVSGLIARPEMRRLMARMMGALADAPSLVAIYRKTYLMPRRQAFVRALARMQATGLIAPERDLELLADMVMGALIQRVMMTADIDDTPEAARAYMLALLRQAGVTL